MGARQRSVPCRSRPLAPSGATAYLAVFATADATVHWMEVAMGRVVRIGLCLLALATTAEARRSPRSYLLVAGGAGVLTGETSGEVVNDRASLRLDLGLGFQVHKTALLEFTYGFSGTWTSDVPVYNLRPDEGIPADTERVIEVGTNPIMTRLRYAHSGVRTEYLKPELSVAIGWLQVTRFLRNPPPIPPQETSDMLFSVELGVSALFVFSRNFMIAPGLRYTITERRGIADELGHMDSIAFVVGFRGFLPSPRDVAGE
jgi:hypothetical protein